MRGSFLPISGSFRLSITAHGYLAIRVLPMIGRGQEDDLVFVVDLVEDAPASNSDSPRRGLPIAQPRSRRNLTRSRSKERVENYHHFAMTRNDELLWPEACTFQLEEAKNMKNVDLPMPLFGFIIATRAILGAGIGLLLADRFRRRTRHSVGATLVAVGALTTIPAAFALFGSRRKMGTLSGFSATG